MQALHVPKAVITQSLKLLARIPYILLLLLHIDALNLQLNVGFLALPLSRDVLRGGMKQINAGLLLYLLHILDEDDVALAFKGVLHLGQHTGIRIFRI